MADFDPERVAALAQLDQFVRDIDTIIDDLAARIGAERAEGIEEHLILKDAMFEMNDMEEKLPRHVLCVLVVLATRRLPEARPPMPETEWTSDEQNL